MRAPRGRWLAATAVLTAACLAGAVAPSSLAAEAVSPQERFAAGNRHYEAGDYEAAIEAYSDLVGRGAVDKDLFYNLANAYYKTDALGPAVLFYERARRLAPRDEDVAANLSLVRALLRDQQLAPQSSWLHRAIRWLPGRLSTHELVRVTSVLFILLALIAISFVFRDTRVMRRTYSTLSLASPGRLLGLEMAQDFVLAMCVVFVLFAFSAGVAGTRYRAESQRREAVVMDEEVPVLGGPTTEATLQFKIHQGTVVWISQARPGWLEIELPGDLSGWVRDGVVERI